MRDNFSSETKRLLAARVGWRCSNPDCRAATTGPTSNPRRASNVGVAAHITAASPPGPRFDPTLSRPRRLEVANGVWLCQTCGKMVDDDPDRYDAARLTFWREDAEALADYEKGRPLGAALPVRFASIELDPACLWWPAHRLHKVRSVHGGMADFGFHEIPDRERRQRGVSTKTHSLDPILDITLVNDASTTTIVSAIGLVPEAVWTSLKGIPSAYRLHKVGAYVLGLSTLEPGTPQMLQLREPIAIPTATRARYTLCLRRYHRALTGNDSLIRLCVRANGTNWRSRLIYMGVY